MFFGAHVSGNSCARMQTHINSWQIRREKGDSREFMVERRSDSHHNIVVGAVVNENLTKALTSMSVGALG